MVGKKRELFPHSIFDENALFPFLESHSIKLNHAYTLWRYLLKEILFNNENDNAGLTKKGKEDGNNNNNNNNTNNNSESDSTKEVSPLRIRDCPGLPKKAYELLEQNFVIFTSNVEQEHTSLDGSTTKLLIRYLPNGQHNRNIIRF